MKLGAATVLVLGAIWLALPKASGRPIGTAHAHDLYSDLRTRDGTQSCCNDRDCRPAKFRITATGVQMLVGGQWIPVPERTIQYRSLPSDRTEGGHWCGHGLSIGHPVTVCAILLPNSVKAPGEPPARAAALGARASQ